MIFVFPTIRPTRDFPTQSEHSDPSERMAAGQWRGRVFAPESNSREHATFEPTGLHREPRNSGYLTTSWQRSNS